MLEGVSEGELTQQDRGAAMASLNQVCIVYFASLIAVTAVQSNRCELKHTRGLFCVLVTHTHTQRSTHVHSASGSHCWNSSRYNWCSVRPIGS